MFLLTVKLVMVKDIIGIPLRLDIEVNLSLMY